MSDRSFRLFLFYRLLVTLAIQMQSVAVAWQVYQITHSALDLGLTGLALFLPGLIFMLAAGHAADRFDRRKIILLCYGLQAACTVVLLWLSLPDGDPMRTTSEALYPSFAAHYRDGESLWTPRLQIRWPARRRARWWAACCTPASTATPPIRATSRG